MTNKFLLNLLGFNPDVTNRKSRHAIESIVSRLCLASLICLCMLTIGSGNAWGATEKLTMSEMGWTASSTKPTSISATTATIAVAKNSAGTAPTYYSDGLRIYGVKKATTGGTISFTAKTNVTIQGIDFTYTVSNSGVLNIKTGSGSYNTGTKKWTGTLNAGDAVSLVVTNNTNSNPQVRITEIKIQYLAKVTFNANGGSCGTSNVTQADTASTVSLPTPTRDGFTCIGWYTEADGGSKRGNAGGSYKPTASETLFAHWESAGTSVTLSKAVTSNGSFTLSSSCGGSELSPLSVTTTDAAQTVYVKATPASGYQVASVTSKLGSATAETLTKSGDCYPVTYAKGASGTAVITVTFETASCSSYSFHDGTNGSSDWQINCFEYSGNADRQWIKNMTIRNKSHYYVGKQGNFYNDGLGNSNAKSYTNQMQYMQLALDRGHNSNNQLGSNYAGVQGTLLCYDNSNSDNLYVDFLPDGYYFILDAAGTPTALPMTCTNPDMTAANILNSNTIWETAIQTVTDVSKKYTVGIKADASIAGKAWQTTRYNTNENMTTLKKRNSSNGFTGTLAAADVTAGLRGKYRIWADNFSTTSGEKNWYAHFVPYYHVTYNGNGASGSVAASADVSCEASAAERTVKAAANGFTVPAHTTFGGWATSKANADAGTIAYAAGADIVLTSDVTLYAIWTPEAKATITLNNYSGSAPTDKYPGETWTLPSTNSFSCNDKTFVGWSKVPVAETNTKPTSNFYEPGAEVTLAASNTFYAVFAEVSGGTWTLDYSQETDLSSSSSWGSYGTAFQYTAADGGEWTIKAYKNSGMQINTGKNASIKIPDCSGNISSIEITCSAAKAVGLSASDYSGSGTITYIASGTDATSQTIDLSGAATTGGYIVGKSGSTSITKIVVNYGSTSAYSTTCTSCANSVTVSYSDPGSGNTMSVTKGSTPIASGSSVKTCSAQSLTVTLTPATHYTVTNFAATGVTGVTTTNVGNVYTVNIPADKTGTLTLTPTFTPETPLTITLNTKGYGTFTPIGSVYSGESFTFPTVTPNDPTCATFLGWVEGTTFDGDGETTDPSDVTSLPEYHAASTSSGTLTTNKTYTAVFGEKDTQETTAYVKVAAAPADWSGDYLIVRESIERAFDGSLETLDAANNYIDITIVDGKIAKGSLAANQFTIAKVGATDNYTIKSASGKYIGRTATSNGLDASTSTEYTNTLAYSSDHVVITSSGGPTLQMNGGTRFRYYASSQQELQLYKLGTAQMITYTYTTNPACTPRYRVTVNSAVGGSPSADKTYEHADEAITLTAHPAAGYSFTGWTITHTEGGAAASVTYTTGSASTETAVFEMPAYDVTVTASYVKIPVASLQVKDGETVIANSGTVNISTGANKTLTVVVTPADAFDHSWSASVTGGGTYASITNVQAGTFQVNGLAQGDATVTVTAPNDGDAKTVTFTVHVTDILPTEVVLKRDGSNTSISELSIYEGQYVKVNVSFTPTPTNKDFSVSADGTFVTIHAQAHTNPNYYATLNGKKVTTSPVNVTFTSAATSSVTKNLAVTVLPCPADQFVDYIHGNATVTRAAQVSADHWSINTSITTPTLSDEPESASADCEAGHYHLIGWLPQSIAEALFEAGTPITSETEGLVTAGAEIEASGITWYAIWAKKE